MKKLFIDIGGHLGQSIIKFYQSVPNPTSWDIVSFEPLTYEKLKQTTKRIPRCRIIPKAAWIKDTNINFYVDQHLEGIGSTSLKGKITGKIDYNNPTRVKAINFPAWLNAKKGGYQYIVVKMNIEGLEYILLPHLLENDIISNIDELYVELHSHKFRQDRREGFRAVEDEVIEYVRDRKTKLYFYTNNMIYFQCRVNCRDRQE